MKIPSKFYYFVMEKMHVIIDTTTIGIRAFTNVSLDYFNE